ncbi:hypothetical protein ACJ73_02022 [Blastomyces percursus]|uniref:Uncharacterized protein n=1 Tax=Blastomyces percursus TaxID=1658174 RepID=A0A1J9QCL6_9EURO|nr:hypothetical protein ACJ73_02022 [Blastomyces percursus]
MVDINEKVRVIASGIADMPQQNSYAGIKGPTARRSCRSCFIDDKNRPNLDYDLRNNGRFHHHMQHHRSKLNDLPNPIHREQMCQDRLDFTLITGKLCLVAAWSARILPNVADIPFSSRLESFAVADYSSQEVSASRTRPSLNHYTSCLAVWAERGLAQPASQSSRPFLRFFSAQN